MTNLTGTKWLINENPSCSGSVTEYSINFHWSDDETRTFTNFTVGGNSIIQFLAPTLFIAYKQGTWYNTTTRTIEILSGTDVTNSTLIRWIQANATPVIVTYNVTYSIQNATCTPETIQSGRTLTFQITPNNGYLYPSNVVVNGIYNKVTYNSLTGVGIVTGVLSDINISGKAIAEFVTVDFTTLSGWSNITAGQHSLTIVAMGNNYADSIPSAAITINKIIKYNVTIEATHITYTPNPLPSVVAGESLEITLTADEGYTVPETVTITGEATTGYTKISDSTGKITISNIAGDISIIVAGDVEKLVTPTEFTVTKGLASWNSVDKATAYEFVAVDSNSVESSIGSYTPIRTLSGVWTFKSGKKTNPADAFDQAVNFKINRTSNNQRYGFFCSNNNYPIIYAYTNSAHSQLEQAMDLSDESVEKWYEKIDFGTTPQTVTEIFYNWFTANGTKQ